MQTPEGHQHEEAEHPLPIGPEHEHRIAMLNRSLRVMKWAKALTLLGLVTLLCVVPVQTGMPGGFGASKTFRSLIAHAPWAFLYVNGFALTMLVTAVLF